MTSRGEGWGALREKQGGGAGVRRLGGVEKWGNHLFQVFCSCDRNSRDCGGHGSHSLFQFDISRGASDSPPLRLRAEAWWKKDCIRRENVKNKPTVVTKGSNGQEDTQSFDHEGGGCMRKGRGEWEWREVLEFGCQLSGTHPVLPTQPSWTWSGGSGWY